MNEIGARTYIGRFLAFLAVVAIPLLSVLAYRREIAIVFLFLSHDYVVLAALSFLLLCSGAWFLGKTSWEIGIALQRIEDQMFGKGRYLVLVCLIVLCASWIGALRWRYKIFSEVYYQEAAMHSVNAGNMKDARLICERYTQLFPQRSKGKAIQDPVCVEILDFAHSMSSVYRYVKEQSYAGVRRDGLYLVPATEARSEALGALQKFAGGL